MNRSQTASDETSASSLPADVPADTEKDDDDGEPTASVEEDVTDEKPSDLTAPTTDNPTTEQDPDD